MAWRLAQRIRVHLVKNKNSEANLYIKILWIFICGSILKKEAARLIKRESDRSKLSQAFTSFAKVFYEVHLSYDHVELMISQGVILDLAKLTKRALVSSRSLQITIRLV